jgi:HAE1 family hydrophobic/amphiphilic exporter-1
MLSYGIDATQAGLAVQNAYRGDNQSSFRYNGNEYEILVGLDKQDKEYLSDVNKLSLSSTNGEMVSLSQFANVMEVTGESVLERTDRQTSIKVKGAVVGRPVGTVGEDIKKLLALKKIPAGITVEFDDLFHHGGFI